MCYDKCDEIEKRLWLFSCESYEEMNLVVTSKEDKAIIKELERLSMDYSFVHDYDHDKVDEMLTNTIISNEVEKAVEKCQKETQIATAKSLLNASMSIEEIAKHTGLSIEEVKSIKKN